MNADRCRMAEQIASRGPMQGDELRASMGWHIERFHDAVYGSAGRWFIMAFNGWDLTAFGRDQFEDSLRLHPRLTY